MKKQPKQIKTKMPCVYCADGDRKKDIRQRFWAEFVETGDSGLHIRMTNDSGIDLDDWIMTEIAKAESYAETQAQENMIKAFDILKDKTQDELQIMQKIVLTLKTKSIE